MNKVILYIVVPCYNEEEVIRETTKRLQKKINSLVELKKISEKSKIMFVNDGSKDKTWEIIKELESKNVTGINLSRNRGHQNALLAGLFTAVEKADIIISMDADLQDDINAVDEMIEKYNDGFQIVYGVRSARKTDTFFKRVTAESFYKIMKNMGVDLVFNHADYRLTSKRVILELKKYKEKNLFLRGIFPLIGFKSSIVYYERNERFAGESKYPLKKMLGLAWDGITSFSTRPIKIIIVFGVIFFLLGIIGLILSLILFNKTNTYIIISTLSIFFGIQSLFIGIIGEYIGKSYIEIKDRPRYIVGENLDDK